MTFYTNNNEFYPQHLLFIIFLFFLSGCVTVGPDYMKPDIPVPDQWHRPPSGGLTTDKASSDVLAQWWKKLDDQTLTMLITKSIANNLDLKEAKERVHESRARRGVTRSNLFPKLDSSGSVTRRKSNENTGNGKETDFYSLGFDASWEIDFFGGTRRSIEASEATVQSSQEGLRDVHISIIAEVARNYIDVRTLQSRLDSFNKNVTIQEETLELTAVRATVGLEDDLARQQAIYNLENTRSQIPTIRTSLEEAKNRIAVLLGENPGNVHSLLEEHLPIPHIPSELAIGIPADSIRQRPDVRQAEYELIAQTARVGTAIADLYPKLSLNGSIGLDAMDSGSLFKSSSSSHSYGLRLSWPIFQADAIRQNIKAQDALKEQSLLRYQSTLLAALEGVENVLVAYAEEQNRYQSLEKAVQAARIAVDLAHNKYQSGLIDFNSLLDTQRSLNSFEDQLSQSKGTIAVNFTRLFKALGGGWTSLAENNTEDSLKDDRGDNDARTKQ